ncbi:hypothetical protein [Streptomyces sp. YGL11-2]|uniref:hypothetical protein n=1 Tax=Streptomyces sp. YGL11-2 TaxID=3414028 RepID=UPI003CEC5DB5
MIPEVLSAEQIATGRRVVAAMLQLKPYADDHVGPHFLWPRFPSTDHPLLAFYQETGIGKLANELLRTDLAVQDPDFVQVATTIPPWPHPPGGPHVDGLTPGEADGLPGHLRFGQYLAAHGADAVAGVEEMNPVPYPKIELGEPTHAVGIADSVPFAHYLLAHNIGDQEGAADTGRRETVYYRLHVSGHRDRWREPSLIRSPNSAHREWRKEPGLCVVPDGQGRSAPPTKRVGNRPKSPDRTPGRCTAQSLKT